MPEGWSFKQYFSPRAGTMLLSFCGILTVVVYLEPLYQAIVGVFPWFDKVFWRFGVNFERYLLLGGGFSLFFLIRSIVRKEPQVQFLVEIILVGLFFLLR